MRETAQIRPSPAAPRSRAVFVPNRTSLEKLRISSNAFDSLTPMGSSWLTTTFFICLGLALGGLIVHWLHRRMRTRRYRPWQLSRQVATPQGSWVEDIEPFIHTPVRPYISPDGFRSKLMEYSEKTRELVLSAGDPGPKPVTKIGGPPWWPAGRARPTCAKGHAMSFIAQVLLADVPALEQYSDRLLSFHYCDKCSKEGKMSMAGEVLIPKAMMSQSTKRRVKRRLTGLDSWQNQLSMPTHSLSAMSKKCRVMPILVQCSLSDRKTIQPEKVSSTRKFIPG